MNHNSFTEARQIGRKPLLTAGFLLLAIFGAMAALAFNGLRNGTEKTVIDFYSPDPAQNHPVHVRQPEGPPAVRTGELDFHGKAVTVSCSTCHAGATPNRELRNAEELSSFHQHLHVQHGNLSCLSCHNPEDYDSLRLADGRRLEFSNVMQLCAQCHGTQARDYEHGAHGGMSGHWDLAKGPRHRNNCIDCHDPHAPKFQPINPVFAPLEDFLRRGSSSSGKKRTANH
jgi:hypothetical protein